MIVLLSAFISSLILTLVLMPITIKVAGKLSFRQTVLSYVDNHKSKSGTPTMGGIAFVLSVLSSALFFSSGDKTLLIMSVTTMVAYAVVGFLDDVIKVRYKQNKGLSALQKVVFQLIIAIVVALFAYFNPILGDKLYLPVTFKPISLGVFAVPTYVIVFLATSNAVNLVDGLDGLASMVTVGYFISFILLLVCARHVGVFSMSEGEINNVIILSLSIIGALIGFSCYNCYPAKIFMGDTGALALGGVVACLAIITGTVAFLPIIGIIYVLTCLSVIVQVVCFKRTGKRVFLMTPIHHHFERKGNHENHVGRWYFVVTLIFGIATSIFVLAVN